MKKLFWWIVKIWRLNLVFSLVGYYSVTSRYKKLRHGTKMMPSFAFLFFDRTFFLFFSFYRICYLWLSKADDVLSGLYFVLKPKNVYRIGRWKLKICRPWKVICFLYILIYFVLFGLFSAKCFVRLYLNDYDVWVRCTIKWVGHFIVKGSIKLVGVELLSLVKMDSFKITSWKLCNICFDLHLHNLLSMIFPSVVFRPIFIPRENILPRIYSSNMVVSLNPFAKVLYSSGIDDSM